MEREELKSLLTELTKKAHDQEAAAYALSILFPNAAKALGRSMSFESTHSSQKLLKRRIASSDFAGIYFRLDPRGIAWGKSEVDELLNNHEPSRAFNALKEKIAGLAPSDSFKVRRQFLETLRSHFESQSTISLEWFIGILDHTSLLVQPGDELSRGMFMLGMEDHLRIMLIASLEQIDGTLRAFIVREAAKNAKDVSMLCEIFRAIAGDSIEDGASSDRYGFDFASHTEVLRDELIQRVRHLAQNTSIWEQSRPGNILWFWRGCGHEEEVKAFTSHAMDTVKGLERLLDITVNVVMSTAGNYEHVSRRSWSKIVDLDRLRDHATRASDNDNTHMKSLALRFIKALDRSDDGED